MSFPEEEYRFHALTFDDFNGLTETGPMPEFRSSNCLGCLLATIAENVSHAVLDFRAPTTSGNSMLIATRIGPICHLTGKGPSGATIHRTVILKATADHYVAIFLPDGAPDNAQESVTAAINEAEAILAAARGR